MMLSAMATYSFMPVQLSAAEPTGVGGSNYAWYNIDASKISSNQNCRESFGIVANYHVRDVRNTVRQQLGTMFDNGQRRLRVPIYHASDLSTGTVLRSTGGNLQEQARENLRRFLADIKSAGYQEIIVGFFPRSQSSPKSWYREFGTNNTETKTWFYNSSAMQENWNVIRSLRPIIVGANIDYKIDLRNEGAAAASQPIDRQYASDIWSLYNASFGKSDTVGFSVATGSKVENENPDRSVIGNLAVNRYNVMKQMYDETGYGAPTVWDFHGYEFLGRKLSKVDAAMTARGDNTNIIIGETFYQDSNTLSAIQGLSFNRDILGVYAWPVTPSRGCDGHSDIPFPEEYLYAPRSSVERQTPAAEQPASPAPVTPSSSSVPVCTLSTSDPDGDGWGWENNRSCVAGQQSQVIATDSEQVSDITPPFCVASDADLDGDGWGWENNASCVVR